MEQRQGFLSRIRDDDATAYVHHLEGDARALVTLSFRDCVGLKTSVPMGADGMRALAQDLLVAAERCEQATSQKNPAPNREAPPIETAAATGNDLGCADRPTPDAAYATTPEQNAADPSLARDRQPDIESRRDRERAASRSGVHVAEEPADAHDAGDEQLATSGAVNS